MKKQIADKWIKALRNEEPLPLDGSDPFARKLEALTMKLHDQSLDFEEIADHIEKHWEEL